MKMDSKIKTEKVYKFSNSWLKMEEFQYWLQKGPRKRGCKETAVCKLCDSTLTAHKSDLMRHKNSKKHKKNEKKLDVEISNQLPTAEDVERAEMQLSTFIAEHDSSFQATDCLAPLCEAIFPDSNIASKIASKRTKNTQIIIEGVVGNNFLDTLYMKLNEPGMFFSIIMDETTTESAVKQCALTVVFLDRENGIIHAFFDMFELIPDSAKNLYCSLKNSIISKGISLENLVSISWDTTNSMAKDPNYVFSHLQKDCPNIACIKCSCQVIHLAVSKACLKLPRHVEELLRNLGSHFSRSYGKHASFKQLQEFFHVEIHKILSPATTSWLSVKECVERVVKQYNNLQEYLSQFCLKKPSPTLQTMLDTMNNSFTKAYLEFMSYVLGSIYEFNIMFQTEKPLVHKMKREVERLLKEICSNFMRMDYIKKTPALEIEYTDTRYFLPLNEIYLGVLASLTINNIQQMPDIEEQDVTHFLESVLSFYVELATVVRENFDFTDEFYNIISVVDPQVAQDYSIKSMVGVWKRFPALKNLINIQALDNEWKKHALLEHNSEGLDPTLPIDAYWHKVFELKRPNGEQAFPNLFIVMKLLLTLSYSNTSFQVFCTY